MAVRFNGPVTAMGAQGKRLTNYTNGCAANLVEFDINRTISQNGVVISENSLQSVNLESASAPERVVLQRYDNSTDTNTTGQFSTENNTTGTSTAIRINPIQFRKENNGSAILSLEYNFNRPCCQVVNPFSVQFNFKEANSTASMSSANMTDTYIPNSRASINQTANFIYGRIVANSANIYNVAQSESFVTIPMYVEGYCSSDLNCSQHTLNIASQRDNGTWWVNTNHDSVIGDGQINSLNEFASPFPLTISPDGAVNPINLNNPTDINYTIGAGATLPYLSPIIVIPTVPWLRYNPGRIPCAPILPGRPCPIPTSPTPGSFDPIVNFLGGGGWAGKGNTGLIVDTNASADTANKRTDW